MNPHQSPLQPRWENLESSTHIVQASVPWSRRSQAKTLQVHSEKPQMLTVVSNLDLVVLVSDCWQPQRSHRRRKPDPMVSPALFRLPRLPGLRLILPKVQWQRNQRNPTRICSNHPLDLKHQLWRSPNHSLMKLQSLLRCPLYRSPTRPRTLSRM